MDLPANKINCLPWRAIEEPNDGAWTPERDNNSWQAIEPEFLA
jgi:hypothetical protein